MLYHLFVHIIMSLVLHIFWREKSGANNYNDIILKIAQYIEKLPDNWDGEGAIPFSTALVHKCRMICYELPRPVEIYPCPDGSIQLEYYNNWGEYLQCNVFEDHMEFYYVDVKNKDRYYPDVSQDDVITFFKGGMLRD